MSNDFLETMLARFPILLIAEILFSRARNTYFEDRKDFVAENYFEKNMIIGLLGILMIYKIQRSKAIIYIENHKIKQQQETLQTVLTVMPDAVAVVKKDTLQVDK